MTSEGTGFQNIRALSGEGRPPWETIRDVPHGHVPVYLSILPQQAQLLVLYCALRPLVMVCVLPLT